MARRPPRPKSKACRTASCASAAPFPVALADNVLTIAMADPLDFETIAAVRAFSGLQVRTALAAEQEILDAIDRNYGETEQRTYAEGDDERPAPISNTCATWRARRPSSAWSTP